MELSLEINEIIALIDDSLIFNTIIDDEIIDLVRQLISSAKEDKATVNKEIRKILDNTLGNYDEEAELNVEAFNYLLQNYSDSKQNIIESSSYLHAILVSSSYQAIESDDFKCLIKSFPLIFQSEFSEIVTKILLCQDSSPEVIEFIFSNFQTKFIELLNQDLSIFENIFKAYQEASFEDDTVNFAEKIMYLLGKNIWKAQTKKIIQRSISQMDMNSIFILGYSREGLKMLLSYCPEIVTPSILEKIETLTTFDKIESSEISRIEMIYLMFQTPDIIAKALPKLIEKNDLETFKLLFKYDNSEVDYDDDEYFLDEEQNYLYDGFYAGEWRHDWGLIHIFAGENKIDFLEYYLTFNLDKLNIKTISSGTALSVAIESNSTEAIEYLHCAYANI